MAELLIIPAMAVLGLYSINNQKKKTRENFVSSETKERGNGGGLPNTNIQDVNFPNKYPIENGNSETNTTNNLSNVNRYDGTGAYTDKYFNPRDEIGPSNRQYKSLQGLQGSDYFTHNNMQPFFGSKSRDTYNNDNVNESRLDSMIGNGSQSFTKRELSPMFEAKDSIKWTNGMPSTTDFLHSRIEGNISNKQNNVLPFQQERVGPGLGLGATTEGAGGFNAGMSQREYWQDKNVDELRMASKPKSSELSQLGFEGGAGAIVKNQGYLGIVEKNRPETTFEFGMERSIGAMSSVKMAGKSGEIIDRYVSRPETQTSYVGNANASNNRSDLEGLVEGEFMPSRHIDLDPIPVGNLTGTHYSHANTGDFGLTSTTNSYRNNRTSNYNDDYFGIISSVIGSVLSPLSDIINPKKKDNFIGSLRPYQNIYGNVKNNYVFNPRDKTPVTNRELLRQPDNLFLVNSSLMQNGGGYITTNHNSSHSNQRDITEQFSSYIGGGNAQGIYQSNDYGNGIYQTNGNKEELNKNIQRSPNGGTSIFNNQINVSQNINRENLHNQEYHYAPQMKQSYSPIENIGENTLYKPQIYSNISLDRNKNEIMGEILKSNPYALSI